MAKRKHEEARNESSKAIMAVMTVGGLAVLGLVVWALTRTVQPAPEPAPTAVATAPMGVEQTTANPALPVPETTAAQQTSTYTPNPPSEDENESVPRIAVDDLKAKIDAKQVTVIDVRADTAFMTAHIPGSINIPMATIEAQIASLPKDKPIVTYCT